MKKINENSAITTAEKEAEIEIILKPLVQNGRNIKNEILSQVNLYNADYQL